MYSILDKEERARSANFLHQADQFAFIAAHALLRVMLCHFAGAEPGQWRFSTGSHGKPHLHQDHRHQAIEFNMSHTRGAVACGMVSGCPIGIDIEDEDRAANYVDIADAYFATAELARLRAVPEAQRPGLFLLLWTLKEAYVKARGQGLSLPLDDFAFSLAPITISFRQPGFDNPAQWQFESVRCNDRHRLSVAIRTGNPIPFTCRQVSYDEIDRFIASSEVV